MFPKRLAYLIQDIMKLQQRIILLMLVKIVAVQNFHRKNTKRTPIGQPRKMPKEVKYLN